MQIMGPWSLWLTTGPQVKTSHGTANRPGATLIMTANRSVVLLRVVVDVYVTDHS